MLHGSETGLVPLLATLLLAAIGTAHAQCITEFKASPGSFPDDITTARPLSP